VSISRELSRFEPDASDEASGEAKDRNVELLLENPYTP
jgi:hypothetical protein